MIKEGPNPQKSSSAQKLTWIWSYPSHIHFNWILYRQTPTFWPTFFCFLVAYFIIFFFWHFSVITKTHTFDAYSQVHIHCTVLLCFLFTKCIWKLQKDWVLHFNDFRFSIVLQYLTCTICRGYLLYIDRCLGQMYLRPLDCKGDQISPSSWKSTLTVH